MAKIRKLYNQVPHLTQDTTRESNKYNKHHQQEPRGQPFPSRWPQGSNEQVQKREKHKIQKHKWSTKEVPPCTVCKNILLEGLNRFHGPNFTLSSDVDQDL